MARMRAAAIALSAIMLSATVCVSPAMAQSGEGYLAFVEWCRSIGGTHVPGPGYGRCDPGSSSGSSYDPNSWGAQLGAQFGTWIRRQVSGEAARDARQQRASDLNRQGLATDDPWEKLRLYREARQLWDLPVFRLNLMYALINAADAHWYSDINRGAEVLDRIEQMLNEAEALNGADLASFELYPELINSLHSARNRVAQQRAALASQAANAAALQDASTRISDIAGRIANEIGATADPGAVDLGFGDPTHASAASPVSITLADPGSDVGMIQRLAQSRGWSAEEQQRLTDVLNNLDPDSISDEEMLRRMRAREQTWTTITARSTDAGLAAAAAQGQGPALYSSGWQSGVYDDCAVFALATAAGVPYGIVADRALGLVRDAAWRDAEERSDPMQVLRRGGGGLTGGEVVMLAEMLGQAEVVRLDQMADTLRQGRPVLVTAALNFTASSLHQIVLSRTFEHNGQVWFEAIDSQAAGNQRIFLSYDELVVNGYGNGVSYRPEANTTPALLR